MLIKYSGKLKFYFIMKITYLTLKFLFKPFMLMLSYNSLHEQNSTVYLFQLVRG